MKRYILFLIASVIAIGAIDAQNRTKSKKQWAQYNRYAVANKQLTVSPDVVFMGNSITDNWAAMVPEFFADNNYLGRGISGQTTEQMLARFRQDVVDLNPKVVVILAGINDIAENNGPISKESILNNIKSMCDIAKANNITPVLCSILPCDYFVWRKTMKPAPIVAEMNAMIKDYAREAGYRYVDYYSALVTETGALNPKLTKDRCHPTKDGYQIMMPIVKQMLEETLVEINDANKQ